VTRQQKYNEKPSKNEAKYDNASHAVTPSRYKAVAIN